MSESQAARIQMLREDRATESRVAAAEARAKRIADGTAIRMAKLADTAFMASPAADRVAYWQSFKKLYPEIPPGDEYTAALHELEQDYAVQRAETARQQKISDLEQRVADAENHARQAESRSATVIYGAAPYYAQPSWGWSVPTTYCPTPALPASSVFSSWNAIAAPQKNPPLVQTVPFGAQHATPFAPSFRFGTAPASGDFSDGESGVTIRFR